MVSFEEIRQRCCRETKVIFFHFDSPFQRNYLYYYPRRFTPSKPDDNADPSANLMTMMKQMYDEGDDEMKRTIAKAWTESRDKQSNDMPDLGGLW